MSLAYTNVLTTTGITFTVAAGLGVVVPRLNPSTRRYYLFLLAWAPPYLLGQISQHDKWGWVWTQYHLCDLTFIPAATAFGAALYATIQWLRQRATTQRGILLSMVAIYPINIAICYGGELWDTYHLWTVHGSLVRAIDWHDYLSFGVGLALTIMPCMLFPPAITRALAD